jgi:hypothetical protein
MLGRLIAWLLDPARTLKSVTRVFERKLQALERAKDRAYQRRADIELTIMELNQERDRLGGVVLQINDVQTQLGKFVCG